MTGLVHFSHFIYCPIFSSPEPKAPGELVVLAGSVVRPQFQTTSSETTGPIATKFHIQPPGPLGKKSSNGLGHMTNIYGKNLKKSSSPEPVDQ